MSIVNSVQKLFEVNPDQIFSRSQVMTTGGYSKGNRIAVFAALKKLKARGVIANPDRGRYQLLNGPATPDEKPKRKYVRKDNLPGTSRDVMVYLNHARTSMKDKDSPAYMLVSLALLTLQGKI